MRYYLHLGGNISLAVCVSVCVFYLQHETDLYFVPSYNWQCPTASSIYVLYDLTAYLCNVTIHGWYTKESRCPSSTRVLVGTVALLVKVFLNYDNLSSLVVPCSAIITPYYFLCCIFLSSGDFAG